MNPKELVDLNKELIIKRCQELIRIPSVLKEFNPNNIHPFGDDIYHALEYTLNMAKNDGFEVLNDDNYAGHIEYGNQDGKLIGILCHLDVVPEGDHWLYPPYDATVVDGKLYGRGSGDDKGPTIAAYMALKFIKDCGIKLKNKVRLILGCDEETGWRGVMHYFQKHEMPELGFAPDADFPLIYGEKGRMSYDLSCNDYEDDILESITGGERYNVVLEEVKAIVKKDLTKEFVKFAEDNKLGHEEQEVDGKYELILRGKSAHAMEPQNGINAGTYMCKFLSSYTNHPLVKFVSTYLHLGYYLDKMGLDYNDYEMGRITCNIGIMNISNSNNRVTLDIRFPVRYDVNHFENVFNNLSSSYDIIITEHHTGKVHYVSPDDELVQKLYKAYLDNTHDTINKPFTIGGGTYASILPKGVAFGMKLPQEEELAHQRNEFIYIDTLLMSVKVYIDAILALGEVDA